MESNPPAEDPAAATFCRKYLEEHPQAPYKDVRRHAWEEGLKVTRQDFSAVNRQLSAAVRGEDPASSEGESSAGPKTSPAASGAKAEGQKPSWDNLFGATPDTGSGQRAPERPERKTPESPTETARRALGLLSSPAARDEPRQNAVEFMASYLREKPEAGYKEVREAAESNGYTVSSATFGRAQAITGLLDDDDDEEGDAKASVGKGKGKEPVRKAAAPRPAPRARRRGRDPALLLEEFIDHWQNCSGENKQFQTSLKAMLKVVERALEEASK